MKYDYLMKSWNMLKEIFNNPVGSLLEISPLSKYLFSNLPVFIVNSGNWAKFPKLSLESANGFPKQLTELFKITEAELVDFDSKFPITQNSERLAQQFSEFGSDKVSHGYHRVYASFFHEEAARQTLNILEIGIGTNSPGAISSMGRRGKPGASLRAFANFSKSANVVGADVDREIFFTEKGISCAYIDQRDLSTYDNLAIETGIEVWDLIIDDGLHSTAANINSLIFAKDHLCLNGWLIIEDIPDRTLSVWKFIVGFMSAQGYDITITRAHKCNVVILKNSP